MDTQTPAAMACPVCRTALVVSERKGIEIDYCPTCRGVWLDRGELDKIIERSAADLAPQHRPAPHQPPTSPWPGDYARHGDGGDRHGHRKRRKSFLEELFD
jgi:Zn-finger nucleic acid-binding protein